MILAKTMDEARATRHEAELFNGTRYWRSDFFGHSKSNHGAPQAFFIEQSPSSVVPPHFHEVNQFQVVVEGGGTLGRHGLRPVAIHYTGGHTGYGPLAAEPQGLSYFTLRPCADHGAQFLPQARDRIRYASIRRQWTGGEFALLPGKALQSLETPQVECLLEGYDDGLSAWMLRLAPGATAQAPDPRTGGGQYHVVLDGGVLHEGATLEKHSCLFVSGDESPPHLLAGTQGLQMLILQYPRGQAALRV